MQGLTFIFMQSSECFPISIGEKHLFPIYKNFVPIFELSCKIRPKSKNGLEINYGKKVGNLAPETTFLINLI